MINLLSYKKYIYFFVLNKKEIGLKIKEKLKEIMINSKDDYGSMSSVSIREMLERELNLKLDSFKKFIDAFS